MILKTFWSEVYNKCLKFIKYKVSMNFYLQIYNFILKTTEIEADLLD